MKIIRGTVTCDFTIPGGSYNDHQIHTWNFGSSGEFDNSASNWIPATWNLTGSGSDGNYPSGWYNSGNLMGRLFFRNPVNTSDAKISWVNNTGGTGYAFPNGSSSNTSNAIGQVKPLGPWPDELLTFSINLTGVFAQSAVNYVWKVESFRGSKYSARILFAVPGGDVKTYPGGTFGVDEGNNNYPHIGRWSWNIALSA